MNKWNLLTSYQILFKKWLILNLILLDILLKRKKLFYHYVSLYKAQNILKKYFIIEKIFKELAFQW